MEYETKPEDMGFVADKDEFEKRYNMPSPIRDAAKRMVERINELNKLIDNTQLTSNPRFEVQHGRHHTTSNNQSNRLRISCP